MKLRKLELKDAPYMLEWMHDDFVVHDLRTNFAAKTIEDCNSFIVSAQDESESIHLAIVDDHDEYMGTVSLKHIRENKAEFGITVRRCAMGKGFSQFGMESIVDYGYENRHIDYVYWCVDPNNKRAVRFYDKNEYKRCNAPECVEDYTEDERKRYVWYCIER